MSLLLNVLIALVYLSVYFFWLKLAKLRIGIEHAKYK